MARTKYRIIPNEVYRGCMPVIVFTVQRSEQGFLFEKWVNIKSFEDKNKAKELCNMLK